MTMKQTGADTGGAVGPLHPPPLRIQNSFSIALKGKRAQGKTEKNINLKKNVTLNRGVFVPK